MKKRIMALLTIAVIISVGCTTPGSTGNGKVSESGASSTTPEKSAEKQKTAVKETVYAPFLVRDTGYFSDGYIDRYTVYTFNEDMTPAREDLFDSFDEIIESAVYEKLSASEVKKSFFNGRGELQSWKKMNNNENGQLVTLESYNTMDELQTKSEYSYDNEGNKVSWRVFDEEGIMLSETLYIYESGQNTKVELYDSSSKLKEYFSSEYADGLKMKESHYDENGKVKDSVEYSYQSGMLVSEKHLRANGSVMRVFKYTNDDKGNPVKVEEFDGNGTLKDWNELEYEYVPKEITVWR